MLYYRSFCFSAVVLACTVFSPGLAAQPSRPPVGQEPRKVNGVVRPASAEQLNRSELLRLANDLARYGTRVKSPEALTLAARILGQAQDVPVRISRGGQSASLSPAGLMASARLLAPEGSPELALLETTQQGLAQLKSSYSGSVSSLPEQLEIGASQSYAAQFSAEKTWMVAVNFDGGLLSLEVLDEAGQLIGARESSSGYLELSGVPEWDGAFTVRLKNVGSQPCKAALTVFDAIGKVTRL